MKLLLAVGADTDPERTLAYLLNRFVPEELEIDLLAAVSAPAPGAACPVREQAGRMLQVLRGQPGFSRVRSHLREGEPAELILEGSRRLHSNLILLGAPRRHGLLTAFGHDSIVRRVCERSRCPVELLRPDSMPASGGNRVLVTLGLDQLDAFPFEQLERKAWPEGSCLRILAVQSPSIETGRAEASPAAVLREMTDAASDRAWAEARLETLSRELKAALGSRVHVDFRIPEGSPREVALRAASGLEATLLVLGSAVSDGGFRGMFSALSPAAISMVAPCSVLVLRGDAGREEGSGQDIESQLAGLSRP